MASGDPGLLAFRDYVRRAAGLFQQITKLREEQKQLIQGLKSASSRRPFNRWGSSRPLPPGPV